MWRFGYVASRSSLVKQDERVIDVNSKEGFRGTASYMDVHSL